MKNKKQILVLDGKSKQLNRLCRLIGEMCEHADVLRTTDLEEAYRIIFCRNIELIFVRVFMERRYDDSRIRFIEQVRQKEETAFVPIIVITTDEVNIRHFLGELHCFGIMEPQFDQNYAQELIENALKFHKYKIEKKFAYFKCGGVIKSVRISEILYIEHHKKYAIVYTYTEQFSITNCTGTDTLQKFGNYDFMLCAKGVVVNMRCVSGIDMKHHKIIFSDRSISFGQIYYKNICAYLEQAGII
ncbi:MAG: LytTR family transcriptional regulator DNA-binding domain-containing protein [Lachnospiraceae bacterium]